MAAPKDIERPRQLLVEGGDAVAFFERVVRRMAINDIQIQNFGGVTDLRGFLETFVLVSGFVTGAVTSLGIVRDAEVDLASAFQSVQGSLTSVGLPVPLQPMAHAAGSPRVSVFILPDNASPGMLETLVLQSVEEDPALGCIEDLFRCVEQQTAVIPANITKATVYAYLASRRNPALRLGQALDAGYWPWASPAFDPVRQFLGDL